MKKSFIKKQFSFSLIFFFLVFVSISCQQSNRQSTQYNNQQKPRSILTNSIQKNQQISIEVNVFNSTNQIYKNIYQTTYIPNLQEKILPLSVEIFQQMDNLTMRVVFNYKDIYTGQYVEAWKGQGNLTKFKKITKLNNQQFFATGQIGSTSTKNQKGNFTLHIAEDFNIMIIYSDMTIPGQEKQLFRKLNFKVSQFQFNGLNHEAKYTPRLDISQMHIPYKYYKPISGFLQQNNQTQKFNMSENNILDESQKPCTIKNHTIKIHIYPYDLMKYALFHQMFDPSQRQQAMKVNPLMSYMMDDQALDDMKQLLFTNNLYIVAITMIMTLVKTILEIFALKNEFKVWNQIEKNKGLSIKILYTDLLFQLVFFLYLVDNESNLMMTVPMAFGIIVVLWKIKKTIYIENLNQFPFLRFRHYDWCKHHEKIDNQGVSYMYYGLGFLFAGYLGYQIFFSSSISAIFSYSGMLEKLVFFMGMAGFIRMTPQLYINYKLKSVDHLPWRTLIYRFIETIIDDFYVFLVTTPLLHKIMVFREDVIFLLYLYQRIIYKTDPNRIGTAGGMVLQKKQFQKVSSSINSIKTQKNQ